MCVSSFELSFVGANTNWFNKIILAGFYYTAK